MGSILKMNTLQEKYNNFMTPDFCIKIDGKKLERSKMFIDDVKIKLSADAAGSLTFRIYNAYDVEKRSFDSKVDKIIPGKIITAEIGYVGSMTLVFKGYIYSVHYEYSDTPEVFVTAVDLIRLMQENSVVKKIYDKVTPTDAFKKVMKFYQKICPQNDVKAEHSTSEKRQIIQEGTDYSFVKEVLCSMEGRDFYVFAGKAYFEDIKKKGEAVVELEWEKDILSFSYERQYLEKIIRANLVDSEKTMVSILNEKKITGTSQDKVLSSPVVKNVFGTSMGDALAAENRAMKEAVKELKASIICSGSCIGIPEIIPGKSLKIIKADSKIDEVYEIVSVEQNIGINGFITQFELMKNA